MSNLSSCLVIDLEISNNELLEIGICVVDFKNDTLDHFDSWLIKTVLPIDPKVVELTGITDELVKKEGRKLEEVLNTTRKKYSKHLPWGAWGFDGQFLTRYVQNKGLILPFGESYFNFGQVFNFIHSPEKKVSLDDALAAYGLIFEGSKHRAKEDAYNLGKLLLQMLRRKNNDTRNST